MVGVAEEVVVMEAEQHDGAAQAEEQLFPV